MVWHGVKGEGGNVGLLLLCLQAAARGASQGPDVMVAAAAAAVVAGGDEQDCMVGGRAMSWGRSGLYALVSMVGDVRGLEAHVFIVCVCVCVCVGCF